MEIKGRFDHFNINVTNLEKSIQFYEKALGLHESHRKEAADGSFILVYLTDGCTGRRADGIPTRTDLAARPYGSLRTGRKRKPSLSPRSRRLR